MPVPTFSLCYFKINGKWSILVEYPAVWFEGLRKITKTSIRIVSLWAKI
jgi:hypothetical protein